MSTTWRRYEVLLPLNFNDGREVPDELLAEAIIEVRTRFRAVRYERQGIEGQWQEKGVFFGIRMNCRSSSSACPTR